MDGISNMIVFICLSHKHQKGLSINKSIVRYDCCVCYMSSHRFYENIVSVLND